MDYCWVLSHSNPPPPTWFFWRPGLCNGVAWMSLQGGLWTGSWLYSSIPAPPPTVASCCWSLACFFFFFPPWGGKSWYQTHCLTCLTLAPPPGPAHRPSTIWGIPTSLWCSCMSCNLKGSDLQAILLYPTPAQLCPRLWRALCTH